MAVTCHFLMSQVDVLMGGISVVSLHHSSSSLRHKNFSCIPLLMQPRYNPSMLAGLIACALTFSFGEPRITRAGPPQLPGVAQRSMRIGGNLVLEYTLSWGNWTNAHDSGSRTCHRVGIKKVHQAHSQCTDGSCYSECPRSHEDTRSDFASIVRLNEGFRVDMRKWQAELKQSQNALQAFVFDEISLRPVMLDVERTAVGRVKDMKDELDYAPTDHFAAPCTIADRWVQYMTAECTMTYKLRNSTINTVYDENKMVVASVIAPGNEYEVVFSRCVCNPRDIPPVRENNLIGSSGEPVHPKDGQTAGVWVDQNGTGEFALLAEADYSKSLTFQCSGMGKFEVSWAPQTERPKTVVVLPGLVLDSADPKTQDILVCGATKFSPQANEKGLGRAACLEMEKKEPTLSTQFKPTFPKDDFLLRLAYIHAKARFGGSWDQARAWIYTNGATQAAMAKILIPRISPTRFVDELQKLQGMGLNLMSLPVRNSYDAQALTAEELDASRRQFLAELFVNADLVRAFKWLQSQQALKQQKRHETVAMVDVARELLKQPSPEARLKAMNLLKDALARGTTDAFDLAGGWDLIAGALLLSDAKLAEKALEILEKHKPQVVRGYLINPNPLLPPEILARCERLLKSL